MSRLLQAQARPEEAIAVKKAEPEISAPVAVAEEEPEFNGSYINEFKYSGITPAVAHDKLPPLDIAPVFTLTPQVTRPSFPSSVFVPPAEAGFVPFPTGWKRYSPAPLESEPAAVSVAGHMFPALPETTKEQRNPASAEVRPLTDRPSARNRPIDIRSAAVSPTEAAAVRLEMPAVVIPSRGMRRDGQDLPKAGKIALQLPIALPPESSAEIGLLEEFPSLTNMCPEFELGLTLMVAQGEPQETIEPEPGITQEVHAELAETVEASREVTPSVALEALSNMQVPAKPTEPIGPPINRTLRRIGLPAVAPSASVLTPGFDCVPMQTLPRMQRYATQPLRPKMALVTVSRPLAARADVGTPAGKRPAKEMLQTLPKSGPDVNGSGKQDGPRQNSKSMLHLDDEAPVEPDNGTDSGSLLGKLGGLFGKKHKGS